MGTYARRTAVRAATAAAIAAATSLAEPAFARPPADPSAMPGDAPARESRSAPLPAEPPAATEPATEGTAGSEAPSPVDASAPPIDPSGGFTTTPFQPKPPPLHVDYLQYGVALVANARLASGATCPDVADTPCILGGGGGLVVRVGRRPPGPWYWGAAYEFSNMDSGNLYRLGILQQLRAETRYVPATGLRVQPYVAGGLGGFAYGNEWGVETGGAAAFVGGGFEFEVTRFALVGVGLSYVPILIAGWTDTANQERSTSLAQFLRLELVFELRSELSRDSYEDRQTATNR
jgi:hypothetical protein